LVANPTPNSATRARTRLLGLLAACALPFVVSNYRTFQFTLALVYAIALLGLNMLTGYNGQISLGHGAFYAIGAYTAAILMDQYELPYWATIPVAAVVCLLAGFLFGLPALRLEGLYLALAMTEPNTGSDLAALKSTAKRDGDHYDDDDQFIDQCPEEVRQGVPDQCRPVIGGHDLDPLWKRWLERLQPLQQRTRHGQDVATLFHDRNATDDFAVAVQIGDAAPEVVSDLDVADVLEIHRLAAHVAADHQELELVDALGAHAAP